MPSVDAGEAHVIVRALLEAIVDATANGDVEQARRQAEIARGLAYTYEAEEER